MNVFGKEEEMMIAASLPRFPLPLVGLAHFHMQMLHFPMIERALEIRNEAKKGFSDLNAAATLPATRTNEPRSHVLLSPLFIRVG